MRAFTSVLRMLRTLVFTSSRPISQFSQPSIVVVSQMRVNLPEMFFQRVTIECFLKNRENMAVRTNRSKVASS
jgi:hypothetical protein